MARAGHGKLRLYEGETSRSAHQRAKEHLAALDNGEVGHPFTRHGWEEHAGRKPEIIMAVRSRHISALDRQATEAGNISRLYAGPDEANLNSKTE